MRACRWIRRLVFRSVTDLQVSKKELLGLDFEGTLKFFRVSLPKRYRNEENARQLVKTAVATKVKKLRKYEKEYLAIKGWWCW